MYLDISFIFPKSKDTQNNLFSFLKKEYGLVEGENPASVFYRKKVIVFLVENKDADYDEICVDLADQTFHKETFEKEVRKLTDFVNRCFEHDQNLKYALCSYELNGYLLGGIKRLKDFDYDLLRHFPFVYERVKSYRPPLLQINKDAQNLFV